MNGVINVYKEGGMTSSKLVSEVKKILNGVKCGHLGTLDPLAIGVLPICVGYGTRFSDYIADSKKVYIASFKLGVATNSYDIEGKVIKENDTIKPTLEEINKELSKLVGKVELKVPAFSAKKINGVRAYELARKGELEDAGNCIMEIDSIDVLMYEYPYGLLRISCHKGTYIRSIINTLGENIGCYAIMTELERKVNGPFNSDKAITLDKLKELNDMRKKGEIDEKQFVTPVESLLDWPIAIVKDSTISKIMNGISPGPNDYLSLPIEDGGEYFFIQNQKRKLVAVATRQDFSKEPLKLKMVFNT